MCVLKFSENDKKNAEKLLLAISEIVRSSHSDCMHLGTMHMDDIEKPTNVVIHTLECGVEVPLLLVYNTELWCKFGFMEKVEEQSDE